MAVYKIDLDVIHTPTGKARRVISEDATPRREFASLYDALLAIVDLFKHRRLDMYKLWVELPVRPRDCPAIWSFYCEDMRGTNSAYPELLACILQYADDQNGGEK